jgi:hypothetical protein
MPRVGVGGQSESNNPSEVTTSLHFLPSPSSISNIDAVPQDLLCFRCGHESTVMAFVPLNCKLPCAMNTEWNVVEFGFACFATLPSPTPTTPHHTRARRASSIRLRRYIHVAAVDHNGDDITSSLGKGHFRVAVHHTDMEGKVSPTTTNHPQHQTTTTHDSI